MSKKILIIAAMLIVIVGGVWLITQSSPKKVTHSSDQIPVAIATDLSKNAQYIDYDDVAINSNQGKKVLFFYAQWCPQCRMIDADIIKGPLPENWTIIKVDYDDSQDLRKKYGVTLQTTFVKIDDQGNGIDKYVAYEDPTLESVITNYLVK